MSGFDHSEHFSRTLVVFPKTAAFIRQARSEHARLEEAVGLADAIRVDVIDAIAVNANKIRPATFIGSGNVERLAQIVDDEEIELVVFDCTLSPVQQRNLEKELKAKVIDRTALILEIFGDRARTREGRLQVELAHLSYQRSRLVRSWTHLERQRGGFGFVGGPGETQIEIDRRLIDERLAKLKIELGDVKRTRQLHRKARKKVPYPVVALVGYTNAGKSTLFNNMTNASVMAKDQLFATLDPTMRQLELPSGRQVILSDTVGFVSELPTELVAAFRATLEEVLEADIILHVRDIAHSDTGAQKADVEAVLADLGLAEKIDKDDLVQVLNKIDLLEKQDLIETQNRVARNQSTMAAVSALTGKGVDDLLALIDNHISADMPELEVHVPVSDGKNLAWFYRKCEVLAREDNEQHVKLRVKISHTDLNRMPKTDAIKTSILEKSA